MQGSSQCGHMAFNVMWHLHLHLPLSGSFLNRDSFIVTLTALNEKINLSHDIVALKKVTLSNYYCKSRLVIRVSKGNGNAQKVWMMLHIQLFWLATLYCSYSCVNYRCSAAVVDIIS